MNRPEPRPVDLDFVEDPSASSQDRDDDAALAALVRTRLTALEPPPSRVDLGAVTSGAGGLGRARARKRAAWVVAGAVAAAAGVVAVVVLGGGHQRPAQRQGPVASEGGGGTSPVPLRAGVPELPADDVTRLEALDVRRQPISPPTHWGVPFSSWTDEVDCDSASSLRGVEPAVLDGLDTRGLRQECATATAVGGSLGEDGAQEVRFVYRFYLPDGVDLDEVTVAGATDQGVSWTEVDTTGPSVVPSAEDRPDDPNGGVTWVPWADGLATVWHVGASHTEISWVEDVQRPSLDERPGLGVRAVVAADPITAVRAAVGFRNQGGMQVVRGDDGSQLLVPTSPPLGGMDALTYGHLTRTEQGCIGLDQDAHGFQLVLWPYGTTWDASAETLTVPDEGTLNVGDTLGVGGGEVASQYPASLLPAECAQGKLWIASSAQEMPPVAPPTPASTSGSMSEEVAPWGDTGLHLTAETLTGDAYFIMRPPPPENSAQSQAKVSGQLAVLVGGCLGVAPGTAVIWPAGTTALADGSGVRLSDGEELRIGDELDGGGGYGDVQLSGRASACPGYQAAYLNDPPLR